MNKVYILAIISLFFISVCNSKLSEEEKKRLWDNAQTQGEIIRRSGTPFNLATDKDKALADAENNTGERCKLNIFVKGAELKTDNLKVSSFCQSLENNQWVNKSLIEEDNIRLENVILNKAKKLKLTSG